MADVINLKRFKKRSEREQSAKQADANRARFGRTKAERTLDERRKDRAGDISWTSTSSMTETRHEVTRRQALDRGRRPQDQRQPRRGFLERHERNLGAAEHDLVRAGRRDRQQSPAGQSVLGDPSLRAGLFPHPRHAGRRAGRAAARRLRLSVQASAPQARPLCYIPTLNKRVRCRAVFRARRPTTDTPHSPCRRSPRCG